MTESKYPVTVHLPAKYLGVDVLAQLVSAEDADALRVEIRRLKASRANLVQAQELMSDTLAAERATVDLLRVQLRDAHARIQALQTEVYRCRGEIDAFENACCALTGCTGGAA